MTDKRLERVFKDFAEINQLQDLDQKRAAWQVFAAGWDARGNPWTTTIGFVFLLAFLAYWITLIINH